MFGDRRGRLDLIDRIRIAGFGFSARTARLSNPCQSDGTRALALVAYATSAYVCTKFNNLLYTERCGVLVFRCRSDAQ